MLERFIIAYYFSHMETALTSSALPWELDIRELYRNKELWKEGMHLEFKRSKVKLSDDLWESYSAFANTEGGIIILGVEDNGTVTGLENIAQQLKNLTANINSIEKASVNVSADPGMISDMELNGRRVIVLRVPKATAEQKPVYLNRNTSKTYFRQHESDVLCPESMVQQMLRDKSADSPTSRLVPYTTLDCIDSETWKQYYDRFRFLRGEHAWTQMDQRTLLQRLGAYIVDHATGQEGLSLAGLLMFGTDFAIHEFYPRYQINFFEYSGVEINNSLHRWVDRITIDGTWTPNLLQFFFRVLHRITEPLRRPFKQKPDRVTAEGDSSGHVAVREALANALIHADYAGDCGITIRKFPDRLELSNSGTLLVAKEDIFRGGFSNCRNGALQTMFQAIGLVDKAGSGIDKILTGWIDQWLDSPRVEEKNHPAQVTWTLPYVSLMPATTEADLIRRFKKRYEELDAHSRRILLCVSVLEKATHREIHRMSSFFHPIDLSRLLTKLVHFGFLRSEGNASAIKYSLGGGDSTHNGGRLHT